MNLREYLEKLNKLVEENPNYLELEVIYSSDDEGNSYSNIHHEPTPVFIEEDEGDKYCYDKENYEEEYEEEFVPNSICVN